METLDPTVPDFSVISFVPRKVGLVLHMHSTPESNNQCGQFSGTVLKMGVSI